MLFGEIISYFIYYKVQVSLLFISAVIFSRLFFAEMNNFILERNYFSGMFFAEVINFILERNYFSGVFFGCQFL